MEKLLAATNDKVSHHIYGDIALVILSKLPLKSLNRFLCARKSWSLLFQNPYFMSLFRTNFSSKDHPYYNDTTILLQHITPERHNNKYDFNLYSLFGDKFENMIKLNWPKPYEDSFDFFIHGYVSVNGILCIQDAGRGRGGIRSIEERGRYVLWNPATGEFQITPISPFAFQSPYLEPLIDFYGFGYDRIRDDYKVIRYVELFPKGNCSPLWEIYSLKSNLWKKLDIDMPRPHYGSMDILVYMDGVCHWWASDTDNEGYKINDEVYLVSFDLSCEVFVKTHVPSHMDDIDGIGIRMYRELVVLNGTIGCISNYLEATTFHISILGEVGVKESWTKLFTVGPLSCVEYPIGVDPIGVGKKGDIFFRKYDNKLVWFNLNNWRMEELGIKGEDGCKIVVYKKSFLPFPRISN